MNQIVGYISVIITLIAFGLYFRSIHQKKTSPHVFTWFLWSILSYIALYVQMEGGAGPGLWVTGMTAFCSTVICVWALWKTAIYFDLMDNLALAAGVLMLILWAILDNPYTILVAVLIIEFAAFLPTVRKVRSKPGSEPRSTYVLVALQFALAIVAMEQYNVLTVVYPAVLVVMNVVVAALIKNTNTA